MKISAPVALWLLAVLVAGCSSTGTWKYTPLTAIPVEPRVPRAASCGECHEAEYSTWKKNDHGDPKAMAAITVPQLRECGACHENLAAHLAAPENQQPRALARLTKTEQNEACGNCHYNKQLLGRKAINPHNDHGLFTSVGYQGKKEQISCLDCHQGHGQKDSMLQTIEAHVCFQCHKEAIVTMGIFQPVNYVAEGEVCFACHAPHGTSKGGQAARMTTGVVATCIPCHLP